MDESTKISASEVDAAFVIAAPERPLNEVCKREAEDNIEKEVVNDKKQKLEERKSELNNEKVENTDNGASSSDSEQQIKVKICDENGRPVAENESSVSGEDASAAMNGHVAAPKKKDESSDDSAGPSYKDDISSVEDVAATVTAPESLSKEGTIAPAKTSNATDESESADENCSHQNSAIAGKTPLSSTKTGLVDSTKNKDGISSNVESSDEGDAAAEYISAPITNEKDHSIEKSESDDKTSISDNDVGTASVSAAPKEPLNKVGKREADDAIENEVVSAKKQKLEGRESGFKNKKVETTEKDTSSSEPEQQIKVKICAENVHTGSVSENGSSGLKEDASKAKNGHLATLKKKDESSDDSSKDEIISVEDVAATGKAPLPLVKEGTIAPAKKTDDESRHIDECEYDDETCSHKNASIDRESPASLTKLGPLSASKNEDESSRNDVTSDEGDAAAQNISSPIRNKNDQSCEESESHNKPSCSDNNPMAPAAPNEQTTGPKTLYVGNLSFSVEQEDVEDFFKAVGEIVSIRFAMNPDESFRGFGFVEFASAEAAEKALHELNGKELLRRPVRLDLLRGRKSLNPYHGSKDTQSFQKDALRNHSKELLRQPVRLGLVRERSYTPYSCIQDTQSFEKEPLHELTVKELLHHPVTRDLVRERGSYTPCSGSISKDTQSCEEAVHELNGEELLHHPTTLDLVRERGSFPSYSGSSSRKDAQSFEKDALHKSNGEELLHRPVALDLARERGSFPPYSGSSSGRDTQSFQNGGNAEGHRIFVCGFNKSDGEYQIRSCLKEHFGSCGEITRVSIPTDQDGAVKGIAFIHFTGIDAISRAVELNGSEFGGAPLLVEEAKPRGDGGGRGRDHSWRSGGWHFGGRSDGGGSRGWRSGWQFGGRSDGGGIRGWRSGWHSGGRSDGGGGGRGGGWGFGGRSDCGGSGRGGDWRGGGWGFGGRSDSGCVGRGGRWGFGGRSEGGRSGRWGSGRSDGNDSSRGRGWSSWWHQRGDSGGSGRGGGWAFGEIHDHHSGGGGQADASSEPSMAEAGSSSN